MLNVIFDPFLARKTPFFTLFILSRASDNNTSLNIRGTNAWAVPHLKFCGDRPPSPPRSPPLFSPALSVSVSPCAFMSLSESLSLYLSDSLFLSLSLFLSHPFCLSLSISLYLFYSLYLCPFLSLSVRLSLTLNVGDFCLSFGLGLSPCMAASCYLFVCLCFRVYV